MKQLETCKKHGGPLTPNCIDSVEHLNTCELLAEVSYLRPTTAPNIRQMRHEKCQSGGYKMKKILRQGAENINQKRHQPKRRSHCRH